MPDLALTRSRADTLPQVVRRRRETTRRADDAREADSAITAARHRHHASTNRGADRFSRFTFSVYRWRDVAAAWLIMVVLVAALGTWINLRVPHDVPQIQTHIRISGPTPGGTCSERDYANERC
jgi:hypothetical protein